MKTKYPNEIIVKRHQTDHITPEKRNYFKNMAMILIMLDFFF